jgi:subtilase family serine protease
MVTTPGQLSLSVRPVASHWYTIRSKDYFQSTFSRNSFDGANGDVYVYNNATFGSSNSPNNASFATYTGYGRMKIGAGNTTSANDDWNTVDIVAHELTHGVTASSAGLVYNKESGALNESFSDIFGAAIERYIENAASGTYTLDWLMGEDRGGAIRSLSNPKAYNDPDTYNGTHYRNTSSCTPSSSNDYCGVHTNSGVQNYWFYLLVSGGSGTNDNGDAYSVSGIGWTKAAAIAYRNLTVYLTSSSGFTAARNGAIQAAADLYGNGSNEMTQVANAWHAVGVGMQGGPNLDKQSDGLTVSGTTITLNTTITNNGTQTAGYSYVGYYLSTNSIISTADYLVGTDYVPSLAPGASSAESITVDVSTVTPTIPAGTYYVGYLIDHTSRVAESNEGDNTWYWPTRQVTIPGGSPNLDKQSDGLTVSGQTITLNTTITNNGARGAGGSYVGYYLSTNSIISTADYRIGSDYVTALSVGATSAESITIDVTTVSPSIPAGTYYVGYIIDYQGDVAESNESDNTWYWSTRQVTIPTGSPNLTKQTDNATISNTNINANITVVNNGPVGCSYSYIGYYLSTNTTISTADTRIGTDYVGSLSAGGTSAESFSINPSSITPALAPGTYYFGYIIDYRDDVSESNESDNTWVWGGNPITIGGPNLTRSTDNLTVNGTNLNVSVTVRNNGIAAAGGTSTLNYYLSTNTIISAADYQIGTDVVANLGVGGTGTETLGVDVLNITPYIPPGTYYIGYIIDDGDVIAEQNESDNSYYFSFQTVTIPAVPDLARSTDNLSISGTTLNIDATVTNNGTGSSGASTLGYYLSTNTIISTLDYRIGSDYVGPLAVGATSAETAIIDVLNVTPSIPPGTYYVGYIIDVNGAVSELDEGNNYHLFTGQTVTIPDLPNLTRFNDTVFVTGTNVDIRASIGNDGTLASGTSTVNYYLSTNNYISTADYRIGTDAVGGLAINGSSLETLNIDVTTVTPAIPPGTYYIGYLIDANDDVTENNELDNRHYFSYARVTIPPPPMVPDLTFRTDSVNINGVNLTIDTDVHNVGISASAATTVSYYLSTNPTISTGDYLLGSTNLGGLNPGDSSYQTLTVDVTAVTPAIPPGNYYIGYLIDPANSVSESDEANNDRVFRTPQMVVPNPPSPTITITNPTSSSTWVSASTQTISWTSTLLAPTDVLTIRFYNGSNWSTLVANTPNDGSETVTVPTVPSTVVNAAVRIFLNSNPVIEDYSQLFTVDPVPPMFVQLLAGHVSGVSGDTVVVPVRVKDFSDVISLQGSFHLDNAAIGNLLGVGNFGISTLSNSNFNVDNTTKTVTMVWTEPSVTPINLLDDAVLFHIRVELTAAAGDTSVVSIDGNPTSLLSGFYDGGNITAGTVVTSDGSIRIRNSASISGNIHKEAGTPGINDVTVTLTGANNDVQVTGTNGNYNFSGLPLNSNYLITPSKNVQLTNGVNTLDIVFIRLHILGTTALSSPYRIIAGDVDGSNAVNGLDIVRTRQVILGQIPAFPNGVPSWRFVSSDHVFANPANPFAASFPESRIYNPLAANETAQDFVALKVGDVNNSASAARKAYAGNMLLSVMDQSFEREEEKEVVVKMKDLQELIGMQFALQFNPEELELMEVVPGEVAGMNEGCFGFHGLEQGTLTFSWDNPAGQNLRFDPDRTLFTLKLKAKVSLNSLEGKLQVVESSLRPEAYHGLEEVRKPVLQVQRLGAAADGLELFQNYPNPTADQTVIGFRSPQAQPLSLRLMDTQGRILKTEALDASAGYQEVSWNLKNLSSGVYLYQLCGGGDCLTKRLHVTQ